MFIKNNYNFYNTIIKKDIINKSLITNCLHIPKLLCVEFYYISDYNTVFPETYKLLKTLLLMEFVTGQKYKVICVGKKKEGRSLSYRYKFCVTLRKKNIYRFLYQIYTYNLKFCLFRFFDDEKKNIENILSFEKVLNSKKNQLKPIFETQNYGDFTNVPFDFKRGVFSFKTQFFLQQSKLEFLNLILLLDAFRLSHCVRLIKL